MAGTVQGKSLIHTAACLIIGDEVLGGKVRISQARTARVELQLTRPPRR